MEALQPAPKRVSNPAQRFSREEIEWLDVAPAVQLQVYEEQARSIISSNQSPDIGFRHSVNPYRGCFHACAYCYARPSHQYLDFGAGTDFESKLIVKMNAAELLRAALSKRSWQREAILFSGNTDCYQPLELSYQRTQRCLQVCAELHNPVAIITKGAIIRRDIALLQELHQKAAVQVYLSIAFADDKMAKALEPGAPRPSVRFRAMQALAEAGIPVGLALAPMIPGLNEMQMPQILERAKDCGANCAFMTLLRLPAELQEVFPARLAEAFPERSKKILAQLKEMRGGLLNSSQFGQRMCGSGARWDALLWLFRSTCQRLGLENSSEPFQRRVAEQHISRQGPIQGRIVAGAGRKSSAPALKEKLKKGGNRDGSAAKTGTRQLSLFEPS
jgi:DNA repair photolyase